jgi:2-polyprenyl-3-methyl-5-hydroxy-6-metoxy-1,4-benzoquinol methylase
MQTLEICPYCKSKDSFNILYKNDHNKEEKINFECTSHNFHNYKQWKPTLYKCKLCSLVFSEHIGVKFEDNYKVVVDFAYLNQFKFKKTSFTLFLEKIKNHLNKNCTVLEIGAYYGVLGKLIQPLVKEYTGLELSKHASDYSKNNSNLNIINQSIEEYSKNNKKYDIIIMTDVIEHSDKPFELLSLIEKSLNKNGKLILSTFNFDSLFSKIMGKNYPWIIPMHKYYFSNTTLKNALTESKLELFDIQNDTRIISLEYLLQKFNILAPSFNFIFNFFLKFNFIKKIHVRINLFDLKIYFAVKK